MLRKDSRAWLFVSHSHHDLEAARRVRNAIEKARGHPLFSFLRCLSDYDELDSLIKREIETRTSFPLCDSGHAKASTQVRDEAAHVESLEHKKLEVIDLGGE